jgi:hypothetical protein
MTPVRWPRAAAAIVGLAWFLWIGGAPTLDPTNVDWVMAGDWLQHWLGWLFFRDDPWTFPLGRISSLPYPVGTTIGFTDSNPLVSLLLKPFSRLLPAYFQFIGPWLAVCFAMQGYTGAALSSTVTSRPWQQFLGGVLIALSPVLVARLGHDTLCAHWLLIGLMYLGLRSYEDDATVRRSVRLATAAAVLSAAIHPYLAVMCWVLTQSVFARFWRARHLSPVRAAAAGITATLGMLAVFGVVGYFGKAQLGTQGYGGFSSDLLTFVNPMGFSRILPTIAVPTYQWEGFAFLGLGGLLLVGVSAVALALRPPSAARHAWPVLTVCVLMAVYAVSTVLTVGGREILRVSWLTPALTPFRASGRFIWSFHYLLLLAGIWGAARAVPARRRWVPTLLLALAVTVQAADLRVEPYWLSRKDFRQASVFNFRLAAGHHRHLALFPAQVLNVTPGPYEEDHAYRYMLLAYRLKMTYNSGIFARLNARSILDASAWMSSAVAAGVLDPQTVYIVSPSSIGVFVKARAACGQLDGDWVCVSRDSHEAFRTHLEKAGPAAGNEPSSTDDREPR